MDKKILIINVPLFNIKTDAQYGFVDIVEIDNYQNEGWRLEKIEPVIPNQPGSSMVTNIQYLIVLSR